MDLIRERKKYRTANKRFRRARRLYVFLMRDRINTYRDEVLNYMEERMHERGLYAEKTDPRSVRQSILSYLYKIETGRKGYDGGWYEWLMLKGWDIGHGYSTKLMQKRA